MSVASHLVIDLAEYDERIRTFIPDYEEMLDVAAHAVALRRPRVAIDLGIGTGALAARVARTSPGLSIVGIDEDDDILKVAAKRLRRRQATLVHDSFVRAPFPTCDAITASFALHHVASPRSKRQLFARAHAALRPRGILVSADCHPPTSHWLAAEGRKAWLSHLARTYGRTKAAAFLDAWQDEDFYTTLESEARLLRLAGFTTEVIWRRGLFAVIVAERALTERRMPIARSRQRAVRRARR